jgi:azurin
MNLRLLLATALVGFVVSGCGQKDASSSAPAAAASSGPRVIELTAGDTMKYNITAIEAKAGETITISLTNTGSQPVEVMGHNFVLLKPGSDSAAFAGAAVAAKDTGYIPASLKDQVVAKIDLVGPHKTGEVTFTVPAAGEYPFLCTFPAHFQIGMKGVLTAK